MAQAAHNTLHSPITPVALRLLPRHKAHMRPWGGYPNTPAQGAHEWAMLAQHAEHKASKRRAYEAKLSTRLRRMVRTVRKVCGL